MPGRDFVVLRSLMIGMVVSAGLALPGPAARAQSQPPSQALQGLDADGAWTPVASHPAEVLVGEEWVRPAEYQAVVLVPAGMRQVLAQAPLEGGAGARGLMVQLPRPDGSWAVFEVFESPVMEPGLAAQFPQIKTYVGQGVDRPTETLRMDMTPVGFHAQVLNPACEDDQRGRWYIDPVTRGNDTHYASFYASRMKRESIFHCLTHADPLPPEEGPEFGERVATGSSMRTFRLACAATGEFTAYHGSQANAQAAIVTLVNRVTGIYETELATRLTLVANNINVVYPTASGDPFTSPNTPGTTNSQLQTALNNVIGSANYDVGHVVHNAGSSVNNNGLAGGIGTVCGTNKAQGYSAVFPPIGDVLAVDYVAHELGHQFGGRHTFNNCAGSQGDTAAIAHEPGSGSTIMAYAGICDTTNLQPNSDPYFASINQDQMSAFIAGRTCDSDVPNGNNPPTVNAGLDRTIPANTPFTLTATGSDPNGDALTFSWEQRDGGAVVALNTDNGSSPICRVFSPTTSPSRTVPRIPNLLNNSFFLGEILPTTTRTMNWRVVARDNRSVGGGVNVDDMVVSVVNTGAAFRVTSPSTSVTWPAGTSQTITWDVAGTTANGINCSSVNILFSIDGGSTWPITLATNTPNDGSQAIVVPNNPTAAGRVRVEAVNNIFFNISQNGPIIVTAPPATVSLAGTGLNTINDSTGNGNANGRVDPGESAIALTVQARNNGSGTASGVTGTLTSLTSTVTVTQGFSTYANLVSGATGLNTAAYVLNVSSAHPCGSPISLRLALDSAQTTPVNYDFSLATGVPGGPGSPQTFTYTGAAVSIPDNNLTGVSIPLNVSGVPGTIADVNFRFNGSSCNTTATSTTVGLNHSYVGDLEVSLTSPGGTTILLSDNRGGSGNNFCQTTFDDSGASTIASIIAGNNPFSGSYTPDAPLAGFVGQAPNGTWTLRVVDNAGQDTGSVRAFSIIITGQTLPSCTPPNNPPTGCDSIDFNNDGIENDPQDIEAFLSVYSGGPCVPPAASCNDVDFNNDGIENDPLDIESFLSVYSGGPCI